MRAIQQLCYLFAFCRAKELEGEARPSACICSLPMTLPIPFLILPPNDELWTALDLAARD